MTQFDIAVLVLVACCDVDSSEMIEEETFQRLPRGKLLLTNVTDSIQVIPYHHIPIFLKEICAQRGHCSSLYLLK